MFLVGAIIRIEVDAYDADRDVLEYQFLVDGVVVKSWGRSPVFDWESIGLNSGVHTLTCQIRDYCGAQVEQSIAYELHDPTPQEALRRVANNYALVNDLKADVTLEYILNGERFGDDLDYGIYYFLKPDKEKIETYTDSQRTAKIETIITSGADMFITTNDNPEVQAINLLEESNLTLEQFQQLNINYNTEEFIRTHSLSKNENDSDYSKNLIVVEAFPVPPNGFYSNLMLTIDYHKGLVTKYELRQRMVYVKQNIEILGFQLMGNGAWVPAKITKTPGLPSNSLVTTMTFSNSTINNGLSENDFNPAAQ